MTVSHDGELSGAKVTPRVKGRKSFLAMNTPAVSGKRRLNLFHSLSSLIVQCYFQEQEDSFSGLIRNLLLLSFGSPFRVNPRTEAKSGICFYTLPTTKVVTRFEICPPSKFDQGVNGARKCSRYPKNSQKRRPF